MRRNDLSSLLNARRSWRTPIGLKLYSETHHHVRCNLDDPSAPLRKNLFFEKIFASYCGFFSIVDSREGVPKGQAGRLNPFVSLTLATSPNPTGQGRQEKRTALCYNYAASKTTLLRQRYPICQPFGLWGKSECAGAIL